jgi:hypothetical protein
MELLQPWALWLASSLAIPLWLHFRHRTKAKEVVFPSLLLLKQGFPKAMKTHRLRDLLQLILRLLLLLCLVLALAQPVRHSQHAWPRRGGILIDNSIWGRLPDSHSGDGLSAQLHESQILESRLPLGFKRIPLLPEAGLSNCESRFGDIGNAIDRLLHAFEDRATAQLQIIPVYDWDRLKTALPQIKTWLSGASNRQLVFWDLSSALMALPQWQSAGAMPDSNGQWKMELRPNAGGNTAKAGLLQMEAGIVKRLNPVAGGFLATLPESQTLLGQMRLDLPNPQVGPWNTWYFALEKEVDHRTLHFGSTWASLPSLAKPENRSAVEDWPLNLPMPKLTGQSDMQVNTVMLSGDMPSSEDLERLAVFVLEGGGLILSVGPTTDLVTLNSRLLAPLGMGRLTSLLQHNPPANIHVQPEGFSALRIDPVDWGDPGHASKNFDIVPQNGVTVFLTVDNLPLLLHKCVGQGQVLLWTTQVDSLSWTDIGLSPFLPLVHQRFIKGVRMGKKALRIASDSVLNFVTTRKEISITDPKGRIFTRVHAGMDGIRIGPFSEPGIYRMVAETDTQHLAVNLREPWTSASNLNQSDLAKKMRQELAGFEAQMQWTTHEPSLLLQSAGKPTWPFWIAAAVMLLLADGLVALLLNPRRTPH